MYTINADIGICFNYSVELMIEFNKSRYNLPMAIRLMESLKEAHTRSQ